MPQTEVRELPPLILHPFSEGAAPGRLMEQARSSLLLAALSPSAGNSVEEVADRVARARILEIRMLYYLGKDTRRWMEQCAEWTQSTEDLKGQNLREQSFALLLICQTPPEVRQKLDGWGVPEFAAIFARAVGLNAAFGAPPEMGQLSREFLMNYHRFADGLFSCYLDLQPHAVIGPDRFRFSLYGSGEYSRMLETQWDAT
jgi:hypothetical protein